MKPSNPGRSFFTGLLLFAAGAAVGLLAAPKTGRGSRAWLAQRADHFRAVATGWLNRLRSQARYEEGKMTGRIHRMKQLALVPGAEETYVDDDLITQRVRTKLGEDPRTSHIPRINVDTVNRIVTLRGRAQAEAERQALAEIAAADPDVDDVINKVTITRHRAAS